MSLEYVERKIVEALKLTHGNAARARLQIIAWAQEDQALLQALTKSHLSGIVAYNVERVISGRAAAARVKTKPKQPANTQKPKSPEGEFGVELLKAVASSSSEVFGFENSAPLGRRGRVSQGHINALRAMSSNTSSNNPSKKTDKS